MVIALEGSAMTAASTSARRTRHERDSPGDGMRVRSYVLFAATGLLGAGVWTLGGSAGDRAPAAAPGLEQPAQRARPERPRLPGSHGAPGWAGPDRERAPAAPDMVVSSTGDDIAVTRALVRAALAADLPRALPDRRLSSADLARLSSVMLRVRAHQLRLGELAHTREDAAARRHRRRLLVADLLAMEEITGVSPVELTSALSDEGITTGEEEHVDPVYTPLPAP